MTQAHADASDKAHGPDPSASTVHVLQRDAPDPLHLQISGQLRELIATRAWPPHHRVVPEMMLAKQLGVARGTLRKAVKALVDEGLLVQVQGRGTFVTSLGFSGPVEHDMLSLAEAMSSHGIRVNTQVLARELVEASPRMLRLLELPEQAAAASPVVPVVVAVVPVDPVAAVAHRAPSAVVAGVPFADVSPSVRSARSSSRCRPPRWVACRSRAAAARRRSACAAVRR